MCKKQKGNTAAAAAKAAASSSFNYVENKKESWLSD